MYLFAGRSRHSDVASFLKEAEAAGKIQLILKEFDIERSPDHDLTDAALWEEIHATLKEGPWFLIVSPPCNAFSRARFQFQVHPGPRPLRSLSWPKGFPWLKASHRKQVDEANEFVIQCIHACRVAVGAGGHFLLEHPEGLGAVNGERPGSIWQWPEILNLISFCNAHVLQFINVLLVRRPQNQPDWQLMCGLTTIVAFFLCRFSTQRDFTLAHSPGIAGIFMSRN